MRNHRALLTVAAAALLLGGCAAKKTLSADEYYRAGSKHLREGAYQLAIEEYRSLLDQHPFSEYTEEAELKIAHAHYLNGACPEAVAALSDFQRRQPTSPHLAFAAYLIGQCYEKQIRPPDRDQSASQNAHAYYLALVQQYPSSPFADLARERMNRCRRALAEHELIIARYYRRHDNDKAAETRLLDLVNRFNDTEVAADALYTLGTIYEDQGSSEKAALAFASVVRHHPTAEAVRLAENALARLGEKDLPAGDPLPVLRAQAGRSRTLALAQVTEVPPLEPARPGAALAPDAVPGTRGGPFGRGGAGY